MVVEWKKKGTLLHRCFFHSFKVGAQFLARYRHSMANREQKEPLNNSLHEHLVCAKVPGKLIKFHHYLKHNSQTIALM